jgi:sulfatase maturation enzyme AslB (radical SAM superfamily)
MNYSKQHHIDQDPDHINVHWDVLTICQLNCSYCYARNEYGEKWGKLGSKQIADGVLDALNNSSLPFNLGLLGGEPTLSPHYYYILDRISAMEKFNRVYVVTNGEKDFTKHPDYEKIAFLFSYHPADCTDRDRFFANVKLMKDRGYKIKVNVMLHHGKQYWPLIKEMFEMCADAGIRTHPHFIYGKNVHTLFNYRKDFWEYFSFLKDHERELVYDDELKNDYEIFSEKLTNFNGWSCYNNNYEVDVYGRVIKFCLNHERTSLLDNPTFFKDIVKTVPMICPHKACNCDGLLKQLKVKDGQAS